MKRTQKIGLVYLYLLPLVVAAIGFGIGQVSFLIYFPLWVVNICLMLLILQQLNKYRSSEGNMAAENWTGAAILLIIPWMLFSIFAGMGPPPVTIKGWLASATEQQIRYTLLILGGISVLMGFALLKIKLQNRGEHTYSILGFTVFGIAIPLFMLNMAFWGYYLTDVFHFFITLPGGKRPDWYSPIKMFFYVISVFEVALIYFATMLFAISLKKTQILSTSSSWWYIAIAGIGILLVLIPPTWPEPLSTAGYLAAIPAIPFIMPYLIGVRLLHFHKISS